MTAGCLNPSGPGEANTDDEPYRVTIVIRDGEFTPSSLEAASGRTFTFAFENDDDRAHTLRGDFEAIEITVPAGETVASEVTIPERPGTYEIDCANGSVFELESVPEDVLGGCGYDDE